MYIYIYILYKKRNILRRRRGRLWYNICIFIYIYYIKNVTFFEEEGGAKLRSCPWLRQRAWRRESEETALATPTPNLSFSSRPNLQVRAVPASWKPSACAEE